MRLLLAVLLLTTLSTAGAADTIYVDNLGGGDYLTIQEGLDAASEGDTVLVASNDTVWYSGEDNRNLDFGGKNLVLTSEEGADATTITGQLAGRVFYFHSGEDSTCIVNGFTISSGIAEQGGGIFCNGSSPTLRNLVVKSCHGVGPYDEGVGLYCENSAPHLEGVTFRYNGSPTSLDGAMFCRDSSPRLNAVAFEHNGNNFRAGLVCFDSFVTLTDVAFVGQSSNLTSALYCAACTVDLEDVLFSDNASGQGTMDLHGDTTASLTRVIFTENEAQRGGGLSLYASCAAVLTEVAFTGNSAGQGGGLYLYSGNAQAALVDVTFAENQAYLGGGVYAGSGTLTLESVMFSNNSATGLGGGAYMLGGAGSYSLMSCTFSGNSAPSGGAVYASAAYDGSCVVALESCTVAHNEAASGGGVTCDGASSVGLEKTIVAYSTAGEAVHCGDEGSVTLACCDVYGNAGGDWVGCIADQYGVSGNLQADPLFCWVANPEEPYSLRTDSPCLPTSDTECGLIGAWDVGCPATGVAELTEPTSWGAIKGLYR